jgi:hypothetical protein
VRELPIGYAAAPTRYRTLSQTAYLQHLHQLAPRPPVLAGRSASAELRSPSGLAPFDAGGNPLSGHQPENRNEQFCPRVRREEYRPVPIPLPPS